MGRGLRVALVLLIFATVPVVADEGKRSITLVADEWCPYNCIPNSAEEGFVVDIARAVFESKGYVVKYTNVPWSRAVRKTMSGEYDGAIGATKKEMPGAIFHELPLAYATNYFIVNSSDEWTYTGVDSLKNVHVAAIQDYNYGDSITAYLATNKASPSVTIMKGDNITQRCLRMLLAGRVESCLEDKNVAFYNAQKQGVLDKVKSGGKADTDQALFVAFSPNNEHSKIYAKIWSEGFTLLRNSGKLNAILSRYGLKDELKDSYTAK